MGGRRILSCRQRRTRGRSRSNRFQEDVLLLAERKLDDAIAGEIAICKLRFLVHNGDVIDPQAAALILAPGLAVRFHQTCGDEGVENTDAGRQFTGSHGDSWQVSGEGAFLEGFARRFSDCQRLVTAVHERGGFRGEDLLCFVDVRAAKRCETLDLGNGQA